jgi:hypothetical protein
MRVKLIGVSDDARKCESVAQAKHDIAPAKGHSYSPWHQIDTVMLNKFDAFCVEKKLLDPTFPRADKKR